MDINIVTQQFKSLVCEFTTHNDFSPEGNKIFKEKERLLVDFSKNVNSLGVCLLILKTENEPTCLYFASQFVKDKFKFEFQQLSAQAIAQAHQKLVEIIQGRQNFAKIVTNNLALCLAYLYIHCHDKLGSVLDFFKNTLLSGNSAHSVTSRLYYQYLFKYLDGLACEIDNRRLVIDELKRNQVEKVLKGQQTEILAVLHTIYNQIQHDSSKNIVNDDYQHLLFAFAEWLKITNPSQQVTASLHEHSLLKLALSSLSDPLLSESATEALLSVIEVVKNTEENPRLYDFLGQNLFKLIASVKSQIEDQEYEEAENFMRVLCDYGTHAGKKIVDNLNESGSKFIQTMIIFTQDDSLQVFKQLCDFWQGMIFYITNRDQSSPMTKPMADQIIAKLYFTFCERIMYNVSQLHELDELTEKQLAKLHQSVEDVRDRREFSRYIFESISKYLGHEGYLAEVIRILETANTSEQSSWCKIEAAIYSLRDSIKSFPGPSSSVCKLVLMFERLKPTHIIVIRSILRVYEPLFQMQEKNQEFVLRMLGQITPLFSEKLLSDKVGEVFQRCCRANSQILVKHIASLYELKRMYPSNESILQGLTHILKKNPSQLAQNLPIMLREPLDNLKSSKSKKQKRGYFNKLFTIIQSVPKGETKNLSSIIEMLLQEIWPILQQILSDPDQKQSDQDKLVERAVKFLKLVMRSIPEQFVKYLNNIFTFVLTAYKKYPINSYVYLFEVTFTVYYTSIQPEITTYLKNLYNEYCMITYGHLSNAAGIANLQHLADDFIGLNKRIITFHTRMFLESGQVKQILQFSIHCLGSGVPRAASSSSQLFEIIFMIYWSAYSREQYAKEDKGEVVSYDPNNATLYNQLKLFILPSLPDLLRKMFQFLETGPVQSSRDNVLDCFEAIALAFPSESRSIWSQPLRELPEDILTASEKERFKDNLVKLGSDNHLEFLNAEQMVGKLLYTISTRYLYRKSRANGLSNKGS